MGKWTLTHAWNFVGRPNPPFTYITESGGEHVVTEISITENHFHFGTGNGYSGAMVEGSTEYVSYIRRMIMVKQGERLVKVPHTDDLTTKWPPT